MCKHSVFQQLFERLFLILLHQKKCNDVMMKENPALLRNVVRKVSLFEALELFDVRPCGICNACAVCEAIPLRVGGILNMVMTSVPSDVRSEYRLKG